MTTVHEYVKSLMETEDGAEIKVSTTFPGSYQDAIAGKLFAVLLEEMPQGSTNEDAFQVVNTLIYWMTVFGRSGRKDETK